MNLPIRRLATLSLIGLSWVLAPFASAQEEGRERFEAAGTLRAVALGAVQVATSDNELVTVKLQARPADISFAANAEPSFLRPGMTVKFSTSFNKRGQVLEPIGNLTVFTPLERTDLGIYPEDAGSGPNPLGGLFTDREAEEQPKKKPVKKKIEDIPYRVGGTIVSIRSGKMTVAAGGTQLKCELADEARIKVSLANLAFAKVGDKVDVEGWRYPGMKPVVAVANRISVTALNPLEGEAKSRPGTKSEEKESNDETKSNEDSQGKEAADDKAEAKQ